MVQARNKHVLELGYKKGFETIIYAGGTVRINTLLEVRIAYSGYDESAAGRYAI